MMKIKLKIQHKKQTYFIERYHINNGHIKLILMSYQKFVLKYSKTLNIVCVCDPKLISFHDRVSKVKEIKSEVGQ